MEQQHQHQHRRISSSLQYIYIARTVARELDVYIGIYRCVYIYRRGEYSSRRRASRSRVSMEGEKGEAVWRARREAAGWRAGEPGRQLCIRVSSAQAQVQVSRGYKEPERDPAARTLCFPLARSHTLLSARSSRIYIYIQILRILHIIS